MDWQQWTEEATRHLVALIKIDTSNPPGNETTAARYLAEVLGNAGLAPTILEKVPGRGNLVVRLRGDGSRRPLLLFSHLDVVPAEGANWTHPPFAGTVDDGFVWGRGALDCKNVTAVWLTLLLKLAREKPALTRDILFAATADEEVQGDFGMRWLASEHYDLINAEAGITENGGMSLTFMGQQYMTLSPAEKGSIWVKVKARGRAGHASVPHHDNPIIKLSRAIARLDADYQLPKLGPTNRDFLVALSAPLSPLTRKALGLLAVRPLTDPLVRLAVHDQEFRENLHALFHDTYCLTNFHAGVSPNVIPEEAEAVVDIRRVPGSSEADVLARLKGCLGPDFELEELGSSPSSESPLHTDLHRAIAGALEREAPDFNLLPTLFPGVSDAQFLRPRGMCVYGFMPLTLKDELRRAHGVDERVSIESLELALRILWRAVMDYAGR